MISHFRSRSSLSILISSRSTARIFQYSNRFLEVVFSSSVEMTNRWPIGRRTVAIAEFCSTVIASLKLSSRNLPCNNTKELFVNIYYNTRKSKRNQVNVIKLCKCQIAKKKQFFWIQISIQILLIIYIDKLLQNESLSMHTISCMTGNGKKWNLWS